MPVSEHPGYDTHVGNDVTTVFAFTFIIYEESDMLVELDGVAQTLTTDYSISAVGEGGNVTFVTAPASGVVVNLSGEVPYDRDTDYIDNGDFKAETIDADLDKLTVLTQQLKRDFGRGLLLALGDIATVSTLLPAAIATRFFAWNSAGTAIEFITPGSVALAIPASESVDADKIDAGDIVAILTKLSAPSKAAIQAGGLVYIADTGAADVYVGTYVPALTLYTTGMQTAMLIANANLTTTPTAEFNGLGAKIIKRPDGGALVVGDLPVGHPAIFRYDGTDLLLLNPAATTAAAAFSVHRNSVSQSLPDSTWTKVEFTTEEFDTNSDFDIATNYRFTPTIGGKYILTAGVRSLATYGVAGSFNVAIYKNGVAYKRDSRAVAIGELGGGTVSAAVDANGSSDYFEIYVYFGVGAASDINGDSVGTFFTGAII